MVMRVAVIDDWQRIARDSADWSKLATRADIEFFHQPFAGEEEVVAALAGFDVILAMRERTAFPPRIVERLPRLKLFNMTGRRASGLDSEAMARRGIVVCVSGGGENGEDTAEHALGLMLAAVRRIPDGDAAIRAGSFQENVEPGFRLAGKTIGILGLGLIGSRMARYCRALDMTVIGWSRSLTPEKAAAQGVVAVGKDELFDLCDVVSIHLVLSAETRGIVGACELARMRPGAVLVNTSRAPLVDEAALLRALESGRLRAALDVFNEEPLPRDHPLRRAPNAVLTPHLGYGTRETYETFYRNSVENVLAFLDGAPIRTVTQPLARA